MRTPWKLLFALILGFARMSAADLPIALSVDSGVAFRGDTVSVAIRIVSAPLTEQDAILSSQFDVVFDPAVLVPDTLLSRLASAGTMAGEAQVAVGQYGNHLSVAFAKPTPFVATPIVARVVFRVIGTPGQESFVRLENVLFNELSNAVSEPTNGSIEVGNRLPQFTVFPSDARVTVGQNLQVRVVAVDDDGPVFYSSEFTVGAELFRIDGETGVMSYTPVAADTGSYRVRVTAWDRYEASTSLEFWLRVDADRTPPVIVGRPSVIGITQTTAIVVWNTDKRSSSIVRYGLSGGALSPVTNPALVNAHSVALSSLLENREYAYEVQSADEFGNISATISGSFTTLAQPPTSPLVITLRPSVERGITQAVVAWETNRLSTTIVKFGATSTNLADSVTDISGTTHRATIVNLTPGTRYFYRARSVDPFGLSAQSAIDSFTTRSLLLPPVITTPPSVVARAENGFTVRWVTDRASTSIIDVGLTASYGRRVGDSVAVTVHTMTVGGLSAATRYNYRVGSAGPEGLGPTFSANQEVFTLAAPDNSPPVITEGPVDQGVDNESATIFWKTDELANSVVDYGVVETGGTENLNQREMRLEYEKSHSVVLTDLLANTLYRYRVISFDVVGNGPTQAAGQFRTALAPDDAPPVLLGRVQVNGITERSAIIRWETDEASDSKVIYQAQAGGSDVAQISDRTKEHVVSLTGLNAFTNYSLSLYSRDAAGNLLGPVAASFRTKATPDTIPPTIVAIPKVDGQTLTPFNLVNVVVSLGTDELATAQATFGLQQGALIGIVPTTPAGMTQQLQFTNLPPDTTVYFRVTVTDAAEVPNSRTGILRSFRTIKGADITAPAILVGPTVGDLQQRSFTVDWRTDEASTTRLRFGTSATNLLNNVQDPAPVQNHRATATNLIPGTQYFWRVLSTDPSGNTVASSVRSVTTPVERDTVPPVFVRRPAGVYASTDMAVLSWATDENTTALIYYGAATDSVYNVATDENYKTEHIVSITNLRSGVEYAYFVEAIDNAGNSAIAGDSSAPVFQNNGAIVKLANGTAKIAQPARGGSFTTAVTPDVTFPAIVDPPQVVETTSSTTTITWTTDETANSVVRILESTGGGSEGKLARAADITADLLERGRVVAQSNHVTTHQMTVTQLVPGGSYVLHVASTDPSGNGETISNPVYLVVPQTADLTPPEIVDGSVVVTFTQTQAIIGWQTNELSDSRVDYGPGTGELSISRVVPDPVRNHQVVLTNLIPDSLYSYRVFSTDIRGNGPASTGVHTFTFRTAAAPDVTPPVISQVTVVNVSDLSAAIGWQTDEQADAFIEYGTTPSFGFTRNDPVLVKSHSVVLTNLTPSTKYFFRLAGGDRAGNTSALTPLDSLTTAATPDLTAPEAPATIDTIPASERVILRWAKSTSPDAANYIVYRNGSILASGVPDTTYLDRNVANGLTYTYEVAARDFANNVSAKSAAVRETPLATEAPTAPTVKSPTYNAKVQEAPTFTFEVFNALRAGARLSTPLTYSFVVASDSSLQSVIATGNNVVEGTDVTTFTVSGSQFETNQTYFWAAQASDGVTVGPISTPIKFKWGDFSSVELQSFTAAGMPTGAVKLAWAFQGHETSLSSITLVRGLNASTAREIRRYDNGGLTGETIDVTGRAGEAAIYWLRVVDASGSLRAFGPVEAKVALPASWELSTARPNPFNPTTEMTVSVPAQGNVRVAVFNILGQPVATLLAGRVEAGMHRVVWNGLDTQGRSVASGVYFVQMQTESGVRMVRRVTLLR